MKVRIDDDYSYYVSLMEKFMLLILCDYFNPNNNFEWNGIYSSLPYSILAELMIHNSLIIQLKDYLQNRMVTRLFLIFCSNLALITEKH